MDQRHSRRLDDKLSVEVVESVEEVVGGKWKMKITDDKLIINTAEVDSVGGAKPEPEERPVIRSMGTGVKVGIHDGHQIQDRAAGIMGASINAADTAGEFFKRATPCQGCIHWKNDKWRLQLQRWKDSTDPVDRAELNRLRATFLGLTSEKMQLLISSGTDPDMQLASMLGMCTAYTKFWMDRGKSIGDAFTVSATTSTCPEKDVEGNPLPKLYRANPNALINKIRDDVMLKADGKKV